MDAAKSRAVSKDPLAKWAQSQGPASAASSSLMPLVDGDGDTVEVPCHTIKLPKGSKSLGFDELFSIENFTELGLSFIPVNWNLAQSQQLCGVGFAIMH